MDEIVVGSDGGDVGREVIEETGVKSYDSESSFAETAKEVNPAECYNGDASQERKSSGSSSSDDDEVDVEKNKAVVGVGDEMVKSEDGVTDLGSSGNGVGAEVVEDTVDESIPVEETVKEVVSSDLVSDGVPDVVDSELNPRLTEALPMFGEKENVLFEVTDSGQEKVEAKEIPILDNGLGNSSICADNTARDVENGGDGHVKEKEKVQNSEEQPLISSAPLPVRRTSWMNCCGLFEVFSGGSGR